MSLEIVELGVATTVQDGGRRGLAHLGVPAAGAVDPGLMGLLNRSVGNPADAAVLETAGGLVVSARRDLLVATSQHDAPVGLRLGQALTVRADGRRQWHYLAVRGGVDVDQVLGSRSHDTLSGLGPPGLIAGEAISVGPEPDGSVAEMVPARRHDGRVRVWPGPRADWFAPDAFDALTSSPWRVTVASRVGVRLTGPPLERVVERELPSEGLVRGAIQVPPDGDPIMMLADHPTTGGYPVLAVVDPDDVAAVAQSTSGSSMSFRRVG